MDNARRKDELFGELRAILDVPKYVIPHIKDKMQNSENYQLIFISGCGNVFPFLRTHTILNNLHIHIKQIPIVVFFPGVGVSQGSPYSTFNLFGRLDEGNDYRAANIFQINGV